MNIFFQENYIPTDFSEISLVSYYLTPVFIINPVQFMILHNEDFWKNVLNFNTFYINFDLVEVQLESQYINENDIFRSLVGVLKLKDEEDDEKDEDENKTILFYLDSLIPHIWSTIPFL